MYVYTKAVSRWFIQVRFLSERTGDYIWREYRHNVEESYETLECNLGRPCLLESLIIVLAHRSIKRKFVDPCFLAV